MTAATATSTRSASAGAGTPMDAQGREMVEKLNQAAAAEFDRMYLQGQIQGHRDLLQAQERYIASNPQNREHMNVAKLARGHIREHVAVLDSLQQKIR